MARLIKHKERHSFRITEEHVGKSICMCGLSKIKPFCDGRHRLCAAEQEDKTYTYDDEGEMTEVDEEE